MIEALRLFTELYQTGNTFLEKDHQSSQESSIKAGPTLADPIRNENSANRLDAASQRLADRFPERGFTQVECSIMWIGTIVYCMSSFESGRGWYTAREELGQVWFGRN